MRLGLILNKKLTFFNKRESTDRRIGLDRRIMDYFNSSGLAKIQRKIFERRAASRRAAQSDRRSVP